MTCAKRHEAGRSKLHNVVNTKKALKEAKWLVNLDLPAISVQVGYRLCRNGKVVSQEVEGFAGQSIVVFDASQRLRVVACRLDSRQHNALIASNATGFVHGMGVAATANPFYPARPG